MPSAVIDDFDEPLVDRDLQPTIGGGAKIIKDSISPQGHRLTTFESRIWRPLLAEFNTHRNKSRNSASSRAIPFSIQLAKATNAPAWPVQWGAEQKGMDRGNSLEGDDLIDAMATLDRIRLHTISELEQYIERHPEPETRLHKAILNRYIEVWQWQTMIVTCTTDSEGWWGFLEQRVSEFSASAQQEFRETSDAMHSVWQESTPQPLKQGQWHMPYIDSATMDWCKDNYPTYNISLGKLMRRISIARCARVSLLTHDKVRDPNEDLRMFYHTLWSSKPRHWSPFEHVATPWGSHTSNRGNFPGFAQARHNSDMAVGLR